MQPLGSTTLPKKNANGWIRGVAASFGWNISDGRPEIAARAMNILGSQVKVGTAESRDLHKFMVKTSAEYRPCEYGGYLNTDATGACFNETTTENIFSTKYLETLLDANGQGSFHEFIPGYFISTAAFVHLSR